MGADNIFKQKQRSHQVLETLCPFEQTAFLRYLEIKIQEHLETIRKLLYNSCFSNLSRPSQNKDFSSFAPRPFVKRCFNRPVKHTCRLKNTQSQG